MKREHLMEIFNAALSASDPYEGVRRALRFEKEKLFAAGNVYDLESFNRIIVTGAGKASVRMAAAAEEILGDLLAKGVVIAPYGQAAKLRTVEIREASHPLPDQAGMDAAQRVLDLAREADDKTLVICLLSGGGSALLVSPAPGIGLHDKKRTTELLLKSGCNIAELNVVRKHLSAVKGGRLAQAAYPASVVSLILSDVVGDDLDAIASGPTVPDRSTFTDAARIIERYKLKREIPASVVAYIERGVAGIVRETPKNGDVCFLKSRNMIIGGIAQALFGARSRAKSLGYNSELVTSEVQGQAREAGRVLAQNALNVQGELKPGERRCLLFGGETTVSVNGNGKGGRNQELALTFAREISGTYGITLLSASTDGADGPTDAAGALVDGTTVQTARQCGISPEAYLDNNDSYTFFQKIDFISHARHHIKTGLTGTNVMDMQIILLEG